MFNLTEWVEGLEYENDPKAYKPLLRNVGTLTQRIMFERYMKIDEVEKPNISYPGITRYLS